MAILRQMICRVLSTTGRISSDKLYHALDNLNSALVNDALNKPVQIIEDEAEKEEQRNAVCTYFHPVVISIRRTLCSMRSAS